MQWGVRRTLSMFRLFPSLFRNNRTAIYTTIFGDYDVLKQQPVCPGVDYICFTERTDVSSSQWRIQQCRPRYAHPRLSARWFKMHPDHVLPEYRYTIWIDGSIAIKTESFAEEMIGWLNESGLALFATLTATTSSKRHVFYLRCRNTLIFPSSIRWRIITTRFSPALVSTPPASSLATTGSEGSES